MVWDIHLTLAFPLEQWSTSESDVLWCYLIWGPAPNSTCHQASRACIWILPPPPVTHPKLTFTEMGPQPDSTLAEPWGVTLRPGRYTGVHRTYCSNHQAARYLPKGRTVSTARNQDSIHLLRLEGWGSVSPRGTLLSIRKTCECPKNLPECNWGLWNERIIIYSWSFCHI